MGGRPGRHARRLRSTGTHLIVVDSSVWVAHIRGLESEAVTKLLAITRDTSRVLVGDVVLLEILRGARSQQHAEHLHATLRQFQVVRMMDHKLAVLASKHSRILRARGIAIRRTVDLIIGTFCIAHGHELLHQDRDFTPMATHLGLLFV